MSVLLYIIETMFYLICVDRQMCKVRGLRVEGLQRSWDLIWGSVYGDFGNGMPGPKAGRLGVESSLATYHLPFPAWEVSLIRRGVCVCPVSYLQQEQQELLGQVILRTIKARITSGLKTGSTEDAQSE